MEEAREGISIGDIFRIIFSQKWVALIVAVAITVAGSLALFFGYNAVSTYYVRTFSVDFPGSDTVSPLYPDNTPFNYRDITSRTNLSNVKAGNEEFSSIDVIDMYSSDEINIWRSSSEVTAGQVEITYTIRVNAKYFAGEDMAADFIDSLAQLPINYIKGLALNKGAYLTNYANLSFFEEKVDVLYRQVQYLSEGLDELTVNTGNSSESISLITQLDAFATRLASAKGEMRSKYYVHDADEVRTVYGNLLVTLEQQRQTKFDALKMSYGDIADGSSSLPDNITVQPTADMVELATEIAELDGEIKLYNGYLTHLDEQDEAAITAFESGLNSLERELAAITDRYEALLGQYYGNASFVAYDGALVTDGDLSFVACLIIGLVAGVIVAAVVAFIVGWYKLKGKAKTAPPETITPEDMQS